MLSPILKANSIDVFLCRKDLWKMQTFQVLPEALVPCPEAQPLRKSLALDDMALGFNSRCTLGFKLGIVAPDGTSP